MTSEAEFIKRLLVRGHFKMSFHAQERAIERFVTQADIIHCGLTASKIKFQPARNTWKVIGKDIDRSALTVICKLRNNLLIVTVY